MIWKCDKCGWEGEGSEGYGTHGCHPREPQPIVLSLVSGTWRSPESERQRAKEALDRELVELAARKRI